MAFQRVEQLKNKYKMIANVICKILIPQHLRSARANEFSESGKVFIRFFKQGPKSFHRQAQRIFRNKIKSLFKFFNVARGTSLQILGRSIIYEFSPTSARDEGEAKAFFVPTKKIVGEFGNARQQTNNEIPSQFNWFRQVERHFDYVICLDLSLGRVASKPDWIQTHFVLWVIFETVERTCKGHDELSTNKA